MTRSQTRAFLLHETAARGKVLERTSTGEPIDHVHLARYTLGDPRLEREILGLFLAQLPLTIESLRFSATDRDWQIAAHTLKGSCHSVGAWKIAALAQRAEKIAGGADADARGIVLDAIDSASAEVEAYIAAHYPPEPDKPL